MPNGRSDITRRDQRRDQRGYGGERDTHVPDIDVTGITFSGKLEPQLFNEIARRCADTIGRNDRRNKPSQLRRFYDELVMWNTKVEQHPDRFEEYQPFILMLNAKAAYAEGRDLVDGNFVKLLDHCLRAITDARSLAIAKLFFEAFLGFYKEFRPREN